jgi:prepilin peptidase CpaA
LQQPEYGVTHVNELVIFDSGMLQLFGTYVLETRHALLFMLIAAAVVIDVRSHRIPNLLIAAGAVIGIFCQVLPYGWGLAYALTGAAIGFACFLPMYALRAVGAGDVKLMAMIGVFLGPGSTAVAALAALVAGGVLAVGAALYKGVLPRLLANLRFMLSHASFTLAGASGNGAANTLISAGKLPYAVAIGTGTFIQIVLARGGNGFIG